MQDLRQGVKDLVPTTRLAIAHQEALRLRLNAIENAAGDSSLPLLSFDAQVAYLRASRLVHMASVHIGSVITNLAHSPEAFALIAPELDPAIRQRALDSVADEVAFAPLQGISAEASVQASLAEIADDLAAANRRLEGACSLLNSAFKN